MTLLKSVLNRPLRSDTAAASRAFQHAVASDPSNIALLEKHTELRGHRGCVNSVQFNDSGSLLVSGSDDTKLMLWDTETWKRVAVWNSDHTANIFHARFMPCSNDSRIVSCAGDGEVRLSQCEEGSSNWSVVRVFPQHRDRVKKVALEPGNPNLILSCAEDGTVREFDLRIRDDAPDQGRVIVEFRGFNDAARPLESMNELQGVQLNPADASMLAVCGRDGAVRCYDRRMVGGGTAGGPTKPTMRFAPARYRISKQALRSGNVSGIEFSRDGSQIVATYLNDNVYLFDIRESRQFDRFEPSLHFGSRGRRHSLDGADHDHDHEHDHEILESDDEPSPVQDGVPAPEVCPHGTYVRCYTGHRSSMTIKEVSMMGSHSQYVMSGSDDGRFFIWDKETGTIVQSQLADYTVCNCVQAHPHDLVLVTAGIDHEITVWLPTGKTSTVPQDLDRIVAQNHERQRAQGTPLTARLLIRSFQRYMQAHERNARVEPSRGPRSPAEGDEGDEGEDEDEDVDGSQEDEESEGMRVIQCGQQ
jgi:WD repeat-containing protein 42A